MGQDTTLSLFKLKETGMKKTILKAYKYRMYPTPEEVVFLNKTFGCCRFVYNYFLAEKQRCFKEEKKSLSHSECSKKLPELKKEFPWLQEVPSVTLQQSLLHLNTAFRKFYKKEARFPKAKKKRADQSASFMKNAFTYEKGKLTLAKMKKPLDVIYSRKFQNQPSSLSISKSSSGKFYVSFLVEEEIETLRRVDQTVGVDLGLTHAFVTSDGDKQEPCKALKKSLKKLRRKQKDLSKKRKGSANRTKAKKKVALVHEKVRNQRLDAIHKTTHKLVSENQAICVEDLSVKNLMKNKKLARGISDAGWGTFLRILEYKSDWYGREFVQVDRFFPSSKTCHCCKKIYEALSLKERAWVCLECEALHDRDINAAQNIKEEGLRILGWSTVGHTGFKVCGADVRPMWQTTG
jgi:putative transposase